MFKKLRYARNYGMGWPLMYRNWPIRARLYRLLGPIIDFRLPRKGGPASLATEKVSGKPMMILRNGLGDYTTFWPPIYPTKLSAWEKLRLKFKPIYIGMDHGSVDMSVRYQMLDGKLVILEEVQRRVKP